MQRKVLEIISVDFDARSQPLIFYSAFVKHLRKKWEYNEAVHHLFIDLKKAYDSVRREVLYNIPIEFGIFMEPVRLIKMCSGVRIHKHLSGIFPIKNSLRKGDALTLLLFNFSVENNITRVLVEII
jgi:hypothetical protein